MKKDLYRQIGLRIRKQREVLGLSREKFAEYIGISSQFLAQIELGKRGMSTATLYKICIALNVSADYIVLGREKDNDLNKVNEMLSKIDPEYFPFVEDLLKIFVMAINKKKF